MSNPIVRMPAATARSEPIAKLFVFKKIAQSARDGRSHLCAHGYTLAGFGPEVRVTDYGELWRWTEVITN